MSPSKHQRSTINCHEVYDGAVPDLGTVSPAVGMAMTSASLNCSRVVILLRGGRARPRRLSLRWVAVCQHGCHHRDRLAHRLLDSSKARAQLLHVDFVNICTREGSPPFNI